MAQLSLLKKWRCRRHCCHSNVAEDYCRVPFSEEAPEPVRLAVLLFVSFYYENRDVPDRTTYGAMMLAFQNLLYPYRDPEKMF